MTIYRPHQVRHVAEMLRRAAEVITYNGLWFDLPVLSRALGLRGIIRLDGTHTDLMEVLWALGRGRTDLVTAYKSVSSIPIAEVINLEDKSRNDVLHTHQLWRHYVLPTRNDDEHQRKK